jgi:hypothetical protein
MWLNDIELIYNKYSEITHEYCSVIYNIDTKVKKNIIAPIYDCHNDSFGLGVNFDRLSLLRPDYGYRNKHNLEIDWKNDKLEKDGIFYIDIVNNEMKLLVSIEDVMNVHYKKSMDNAKHKFNHIMISPDGSKFMFLHRWFVGDRKFDSLIVSDINGENIKCVSDDDMVSHCFWYDNNTILGFLRDFQYGDKYYLIDIDTGIKNIIGENKIDIYGDGHPNIYKNEIVFDTYPNKARMKELFRFNSQSNTVEHLGEFYESFDFYGETRCDLHPRYSQDGKKVFIDSAHENLRFLYMIDLTKKVDYE